MTARSLRLTSVVLLASYLLASWLAWVHSARVSQLSSAGVRAEALSPVCCCPHHLQRLPSGSVDSHSDSWHLDPSQAPVHRHDDCTLCRFQLAQKLIPGSPPVVVSVEACVERLDVDVPLVRVAELTATPESRAPPAAA
jgi:hypothetical protein